MNADDVVASLPSASADALRCELRPGETVAWAEVPFSRDSAGDFAARIGRVLLTIAFLLFFSAFAGQIALVAVGATVWWRALPHLALPVVLLGFTWAIWRARAASRRLAASSVLAVTDQRVLRVATWPAQSVRSIEARDITEVFCWIVSEQCGNVRLAGSAASSEANALMYVPNPRACEAAIRALQARSNGG